MLIMKSLLDILLPDAIANLKNAVPVWLQKKLACRFIWNSKAQAFNVNSILLDIKRELANFCTAFSIFDSVKKTRRTYQSVHQKLKYLKIFPSLNTEQKQANITLKKRFLPRQQCRLFQDGGLAFT